jgi:purine-binding chemotaxis protein CheW
MKTYLSRKQSKEVNAHSKQFTTFYLDGRLYGIDVMKVQEVTKPLVVTKMQTAPQFIKGLINLRGQIATAIGLSELFGLKTEASSDKMTVVCKHDDLLISFLVDSIGDVIEVHDQQYESTPQTVPENIRTFMQGVYKTDTGILSIVHLDSILRELDKKCA